MVPRAQARWSGHGPTAPSRTAAGHPGTFNVPAIAGLGEACRLVLKEGHADQVRLAAYGTAWKINYWTTIPNLVINGDRPYRLANNLHVSAPGAPNEAVLFRLHNKVAISTGAACSSGAQEPSHVLRAMKMLPELQESALRISIGKFNTVKEIDFSAQEIIKAIADVRAEMRINNDKCRNRNPSIRACDFPATKHLLAVTPGRQRPTARSGQSSPVFRRRRAPWLSSALGKIWFVRCDSGSKIPDWRCGTPTEAYG